MKAQGSPGFMRCSWGESAKEKKGRAQGSAACTTARVRAVLCGAPPGPSRDHIMSRASQNCSTPRRPGLLPGGRQLLLAHVARAEAAPPPPPTSRPPRPPRLPQRTKCLTWEAGGEETEHSRTPAHPLARRGKICSCSVLLAGRPAGAVVRCELGLGVRCDGGVVGVLHGELAFALRVKIQVKWGLFALCQ